ncbi:hypothetical protein ACTXT7_012541, partial [Hymenolepis weldensis]
DSELNSRWLSYADHVFEVVGFDGLEGVDNMAANPLYDEHHGLLKVLKIPSVSGLNLAPISRPLTCDWAFKVKRKQFVLQKERQENEKTCHIFSNTSGGHQ